MPEGSGDYTILAFDYGEIRVGVAMANSLLKIPHPLTTIQGKSIADKLNAIIPIVDKWKPDYFVVGVPEVTANPQKIQLVNTINNFAKRLVQKFGIPVDLVNEAYSSSYASELLTNQGVYGKKQKTVLDQLAACAILESFFQEGK